MRRLERGDWPAPATVSELYGTWAGAVPTPSPLEQRRLLSVSEPKVSAVRSLTHQLAGVGIAVVTFAAADTRGAAAAVLLGAAWVGSLLPDADLAGARFYRRTRIERRVPLARLAGTLLRLPVRLSLLLGHRGPTHSLLACVFATALTGILAWLIDPDLAPTAATGTAIGYGAHIAADACTPSGVPMWAPFSRRRRCAAARARQPIRRVGSPVRATARWRNAAEHGGAWLSWRTQAANAPSRDLELVVRRSVVAGLNRGLVSAQTIVHGRPPAASPTRASHAALRACRPQARPGGFERHACGTRRTRGRSDASGGASGFVGRAGTRAAERLRTWAVVHALRPRERLDRLLMTDFHALATCERARIAGGASRRRDTVAHHTSEAALWSRRNA